MSEIKITSEPKAEITYRVFRAKTGKWSKSRKAKVDLISKIKDKVKEIIC